MKNILKASLHFSELFALVMISIVTGSFPIALISVIPSLFVVSNLVDDINGNKIKDSIFTVYDNGKIFQNTLSHPFKMLSVMRDKDKGKRFVEEAVSMFTQMDTRDKKGNLKLYKTKSQAKTLFLLKQLERNGYIQNLEYKPAGKMHLLVAKIEMGNAKGMNKKHQMYNISFNLTDKERVKEDLMSLTERKKAYNENVDNNLNEVKPTVVEETKEVNTKLINEDVISSSNDFDVIANNIDNNKDITKEELIELKEQLFNISTEQIEEEEEKGRTM